MRFWCLSFLLDQLIVLLLQFCVEGKGIELDCCFTFYNKPIPVNTIKKYQITKPDCPKAGVVFSTKRNIHVCVDANLMWVQRALQEIDHPHRGTEPQTQPTAGTLNPEPAADLHRNETDTQGRQEPNTTSAGSSESETKSQEPKTSRPKTTKDLQESETEAQEPKIFRPELNKELHGSETEAQEPKTFRHKTTKDLHGSETESEEPKTFRPEPTKGLHESDTHEDQTHTVIKTPRPDLTQSNWFCQV